MKNFVLVIGLCFGLVLAWAGSTGAGRGEVNFTCPTLDELLHDKKAEDKTHGCPTLDGLIKQKSEEHKKAHEADIRLHSEIAEIRRELLRRRINSFQMFPDP